jgi:hypothetical protein
MEGVTLLNLFVIWEEIYSQVEPNKLLCRELSQNVNVLNRPALRALLFQCRISANKHSPSTPFPQPNDRTRFFSSQLEKTFWQVRLFYLLKFWDQIQEITRQYKPRVEATLYLKE